MLGVLVNTAAVFIGSGLGILFRSRIKQKYISALMTALALVTFVIGISSAIKSENILYVIVSLVIGTLIGEIFRIDNGLENAGELVKSKLLKGSGESSRFTEGFMSACILFCVGSMTIVGSLEAGINGDCSIIYAKSAMDFVSSIAFGAAMGFGVMMSAAFVLVFQGALTLLAGILAPLLSTAVVTEMSAVGGAVLIGMAINMLELSEKRIKVANMLPAIFAPVILVPVWQLIYRVFGA